MTLSFFPLGLVHNWMGNHEVLSQILQGEASWGNKFFLFVCFILFSVQLATQDLGKKEKTVLADGAKSKFSDFAGPCGHWPSASL